jgi:hypothetical protein
MMILRLPLVRASRSVPELPLLIPLAKKLRPLGGGSVAAPLPEGLVCHTRSDLV